MSADLSRGHRAVLFAVLVRAVAAQSGQANTLGRQLERELSAPVHDLGEKLTTLGRMLSLSAEAPENLTADGAEPKTDGHYAAWLMYVTLFYPHLAGSVYIGQGFEPDDEAYGLRLGPAFGHPALGNPAAPGQGSGQSLGPSFGEEPGQDDRAGLAREFERLSTVLTPGVPLVVRASRGASVFQLVRG